jgi:hypothetical protein
MCLNYGFGKAWGGFYFQEREKDAFVSAELLGNNSGIREMRASDFRAYF